MQSSAWELPLFLVVLLGEHCTQTVVSPFFLYQPLLHGMQSASFSPVGGNSEPLGHGSEIGCLC